MKRRARKRRGGERRGHARLVTYTNADIEKLLVGTGRPAWERSAHLIAAAKQRGWAGYYGRFDNASAAQTYLEDVIWPQYAKRDGR